jgi:hypothetical protein
VRVTRHTPVLDAVKAVIRALNGHYEFTLAALDRGLSSGNSVKLASLVDDGREFMNVTPELIVVARDAFAKAFREVISKGGNVRVEYLLNQIGLALRDHIATARFEGQSEVPLRPLSRAWLIRKAREGRDPRIGIYTGALLKAIRRSPFRIRKVR